MSDRKDHKSPCSKKTEPCWVLFPPKGDQSPSLAKALSSATPGHKQAGFYAVSRLAPPEKAPGVKLSVRGCDAFVLYVTDVPSHETAFLAYQANPLSVLDDYLLAFIAGVILHTGVMGDLLKVAPKSLEQKVLALKKDLSSLVAAHRSAYDMKIFKLFEECKQLSAYLESRALAKRSKDESLYDRISALYHSIHTGVAHLIDWTDQPPMLGVRTLQSLTAELNTKNETVFLPLYAKLGRNATYCDSILLSLVNHSESTWKELAVSCSNLAETLRVLQGEVEKGITRF